MAVTFEKKLFEMLVVFPVRMSGIGEYVALKINVLYEVVNFLAGLVRRFPAVAVGSVKKIEHVSITVKSCVA